ncbi:MAG TPA: lysophospholipid acyltransferase family protein [Cyclobacteriaceae bacterium]|nr:lysophospholipid acyltransferase family protein [Cyclobacteriaceae bacterium]
MFLLKVISRLPISVLYVISDVIFFLTFFVIRYRRNVVMDNLVKSLPHKTKKELKQIERTFFRNLCDYAAETLRLLTISRKELQRRVVFTNPDVIKEFTNKNHSVLILAAHQFNWEWLLAAGCFNLPVPVDFVYQPQSSDLANAFSLAIRTRFGGHPVKRETVGREALRRKQMIRATAIVADQYPGHFNHRKYWATFLGQQTAFFHGISQLATLTDAGAYFAAIKRTSRGHYEVTLIKLASPPYTEESGLRIIDRYIAESEKMIYDQPEGWLWSHKRWKNS